MMMSASNRRSLSNADIRMNGINGSNSSGQSPDKKANSSSSSPPSLSLAPPVIDEVIGDTGRCFVFARWLDNSDKGDKLGAIHARCAGLCHQYRHQHEASHAALNTAHTIAQRYLSSSATHPLKLSTITPDMVTTIEKQVNNNNNGDGMTSTLFDGIYTLLLASLSVPFTRFISQPGVMANFEIESLLCHPTRGPAFYTFSKNQYAEEWYLFYSDVELFKQELTEILNSPPGADKAARRALFTGMSEQMQGLYDKYLRPRAEYRLAIPDPHCTKVLREIGDALRSGTIVIGMFDECINRAIDRIRTDFYRPFLAHEREEMESTHKFQRAMLEIKSAGNGNARGAVSILKPASARVLPLSAASSRATTGSGIALSLQSPSRRTIPSATTSSSSGSLRVGSGTVTVTATATGGNSNGINVGSSSPLLSPLATSVDSPIQSPYMSGQAGSLPSPLGSPRAVLRIRNSSKRWGTWKRKREAPTPPSPSPRIGSMSPTPHMAMSPLFAPIRISGNNMPSSSTASSSSSSSSFISSSPSRVSSPIRSSSSNTNLTLTSSIPMSRRHSVTLADINRIADMRRMRRDARVAARSASSTQTANSSGSGGGNGNGLPLSTLKEENKTLVKPTSSSSTTLPPSSLSLSLSKSNSSNGSNGSGHGHGHGAMVAAAKRSRFTNLRDIEGGKYYKGKSLEVSGAELEDLLTMRRQLELEEELEERDEDAKAAKAAVTHNSKSNGNGIHERNSSDDVIVSPKLRIESGEAASDDVAPQTPMNHRRTLAQEQADEDQADDEEFDELIYALLSNPLQIGAIIKRTAVLPIRAGDDQGLFDDKRNRCRQLTWNHICNQLGIKTDGTTNGNGSDTGWGIWSRDMNDQPTLSPVRGLPPPAFPDSKMESAVTNTTSNTNSNGTTILSSMTTASLPPAHPTTSTPSSSAVSSSSSSSSSGAHLHSILGRRAAGRRTVRFDFNYIPPPLSAMSASYIASLPTSSPLLAQPTPAPSTSTTNGTPSSSSTSSTSSSSLSSSSISGNVPLVSLTSTGPGFRQRARSIIKTGRTTRVFETAEEAAARVANERDHEREIRLKALGEGSLLTKINSMGKAHERWFQIQEEDLCWGKATSKGTKKAPGIFNRIKRRVLADVIRVRYGTRWSRRFFRYNEKGLPPWLGFSIIFMDRTLDIVCRNDAEVEMWFLGLQSLTPLSGAYLTKGAFLWSRIRMKLRYKAREGGLTDRDFLIKILTAAKETHRAAVLQESKTNPAVRSSILLQKNQVLQKVERAERKAAAASSSSSSSSSLSSSQSPASPRGSVSPSVSSSTTPGGANGGPATPRGLPSQARPASLSVSPSSAPSLIKPAVVATPAAAPPSTGSGSTTTTTATATPTPS